MSERLLTLNEAANILQVHPGTLRTWDGNGYLKSVRTKGGHRRYRQEDVLKLAGETIVGECSNIKTVAVYCRVSSNEQKQKGDLERQKGRLLDYCRLKGYDVGQVFEEVGSGLNDNRTKLLQMMKLAEEKKISRVVVEHKDRLIRFNKNLIFRFFESHGVVVEWTDEVLSPSFEAELVEDMLALVASFASKIYGKRSAENRRKMK